MGYCTWAGMNEANQIYHDTEWGIPVHDDRQMFEHMTLECLQCGLSWDLMLKKREIFRECFCNFEYDSIAEFGDEDIERILNTEGMIRSPRKVQAVINNARCYQKVREELGELEVEVARKDQVRMEEEFGDFMFAMINAARLYGINPEDALEKSNKKFIRRFSYVEKKAHETDRNLSDMTLEEMDEYWNEAKAIEKA